MDVAGPERCVRVRRGSEPSLSEHMIEDLVEDSVRVLDRHAEADDPRVRDSFAVLYNFESGFDCSSTKFRVMDILLRRGYTYHGPDAVPLRRIPLIEVVRDIAVAAEKEQDRELIGLWYAFGCATLLGGPIGCPYDIDELADMPAVRDLRDIVRRTDALPVAQQSPYACPVEFADDQDLEAWWWQL